jgi:hypothetical protein
MIEKRGAKPKPGERYPCGKLRPSDFRSETQFQRLKENAMSLGLDPMMTSQAGRLWCMGLLTSRHIATIDYIGKVYAAYEKHAGKGTSRRIRSPSLAPGTNRAERLEENAEEERDAQAAKAEFEQLQFLIPDFPREARECIERICVDDEAIPSRWVGDLAILLTMIEDCRSGTRAAVKLTRGNLPLRRRAVKQLTRAEKFEAGRYAAAPKAAGPSTLRGEAASAARRDREGLTRMLEQRTAAREGEIESSE